MMEHPHRWLGKTYRLPRAAVLVTPHPIFALEQWMFNAGQHGVW
jgi:hypothetical protein